VDGIEIRVLGPLEVLWDGETLRLRGIKQRAVLALLALHAGRVVSTDRLVESLWGEEPPPTAVTALHGHVSRLRRMLGPGVIVTRSPGYLLDPDAAAIDLTRFEELLEGDQDEPSTEAERHRRALGLWRGSALADLAGEIGLAGEAHRLDELRLRTHEELFDVELGLGEHVELVPALEAFTRAEPLRERPIAQLMLALYRSGRQADALAAYRRFRQRLREELGLEPGRMLRELERRVLEQDPGLAPPVDASHEDVAPRRTPVSVVAIGVAAATQESSEPDAEAYGRVVAQAREAARLSLERYGGSVQRVAGVGLLGLFGVPAPHEDDASRALRAAREAVDVAERVADEAGRRFGVGLSVHAGVASGEAFAGESPAVEHALRLQAEAGHGKLLADDMTRARDRGRELRLDRPLAGREPEQRHLRETYERVCRERRSALVTLVGPAGIGKSRLVADLLGSLEPETRVLYARCLSYGDGVSLLPEIDLVRAAAELPPQVSETQARERLSELLGNDDLAAAATEQLVGLIGLTEEPPREDANAWAVRRLLERIARSSSVVVLVDDLHWAAPSVLDLVEQLAEPIDVPLLVLATARELPRASLEAGALQIGPIDAEACGQVAAALLGFIEIAPDALSALVDTSGGNPLFLEELVVDLRDGGRLHESEEGWRLDDRDLSPPRSIESLLAARLERLPKRERDALTFASVIGRSFAIAALTDLSGEPVDEPLASLAEAGILQSSKFEDADFDFHHLLIRDAAYVSLPLERRAELHRRHTGWLEQSAIGSPLEREALAVYHLDQAHRALTALTPGDERVAADAAALAARSASLGRALLERGDAGTAAVLLARARDLNAGDPRIAVDLGRAHFDIGDFAAAEQAFAAATDGPANHRARLGLLEVTMRTDPDFDLDAARAEIDDARTALEREGDADGIAEAWLAGAYLALVRGSAAELAEMLEPALAHARRSGHSRAETWILFLVCAVCWYGPLRVADGIHRCEQVLADARGRPNVEAAALQALAVLRAMSGELEEARRLVASSRAIRRDLGQLIGAAASAIDEGIVELLAGNDAAAELALREGYEELEQLGEKGYFSTLATLLAEAVAGQGRIDEAREIAGAAADASSTDDVVSQVGWRTTEARGLAAAGEHDDAEQVAREAAALADATDFLLLRAQAWTAVADVCGTRGESASADTARATAVSLLERKGCASRAVAAWTRPRC